MTAPDGTDEVDPPIRTDEEAVVYRNRFITLYDNRVTFGDGSTGTFVRIVEGAGHPGVVALPICADRIALVRVYRYPPQIWEWGLPRGAAHGPDPQVSVLEELREELGETPPESVMPLVLLHPNSGLLAGSVQVFVARYARELSEPRDRREVTEVRWASPHEIREEIVAGGITDGFTLAALGAAILNRVVTF